MKRLIPLVLLSLVACGRNETIRSSLVVIQNPPQPIVGATSKLQVPRSCPIYAPGGGDVDTVEAPLPDGVTALCAVDDAGTTYGIIDGDAPTAQPAVLAGNHEIGLYIGFEAGKFFPDQVVLTGSGANLQASTTTTSLNSPDCCQYTALAIQMVAAGEQGVLVSLGSFDLSPIQVAFTSNVATLPSCAGGFYVNGAP